MHQPSIVIPAKPLNKGSQEDLLEQEGPQDTAFLKKTGYETSPPRNAMIKRLHNKENSVNHQYYNLKHTHTYTHTFKSIKLEG